MQKKSQNDKSIKSNLSVSLNKYQLKNKFLSNNNEINEAQDFYDPYSKLNIFLSQIIKKEMKHCPSSKKWSMQIQQQLLDKILPKFQKKFPQYHLGIHAIKKTWEKLSFYSQQIKDKKEAFTKDGKLNIPFFIKENLKHYYNTENVCHVHPYQYTNQLALKMSECIATMDGIKPKFDILTRTIWSIQRHLIPQPSIEKHKTPFEQYDNIDKLIIKIILEITAKEPQIPHDELSFQVKETIQYLNDMPTFSSQNIMICNISSLLAEKLYPKSLFHTTFFEKQKNAITDFIRNHIKMIKENTPFIEHLSLVRRIMTLYNLASSLPNISTKEISKSINSLSSYKLKANIPQPIYAFLSAEIAILKNNNKNTKKNLLDLYQQTKHLPKLSDNETEILEILIWRIINQQEKNLEKLPYNLGQKIESEITSTLIENPYQSFQSIVQNVSSFFLKTKELTTQKTWQEIENKINIWTIQGDMICKWIYINSKSPLYKLIHQEWHQAEQIPCDLFVNRVCQSYFQKYPQLTPFSSQITLKIWMLFKYIWYNDLSSKNESSFDRFIKWHGFYLKSFSSCKNKIHILKQLEELCKKTLPLAPFDIKKAQSMLFPNTSF